MYDAGGKLICEATTAGVITSEYFYLNATPVALTTNPNTLNFIHPDHLDTPKIITDSASNILWRWDSTDPFGAALANSNPSELGTYTFNLRFPGQYFDQETQVHYNYYRDYDPGTGRYVESDPVGLEGGINTYAYVGGNPLKYYDPDGLDRWGAEPIFDWRTKAGVPLPDPYHPDLYLFTMCLRNCVKEPFVLTSTSEPTPQHQPGTPHRRGVAEDIRYPANPEKYLCCAKKCDAQYGQDEGKRPSAQSTHPHVHLQLVPGKRGGSGDLPAGGDCGPCEGNKW